MNHFSISIQNPHHSLQEMLSIHFNPTFLFEDHKITSMQAYIQKMSRSANDRGLWVIIVLYIVMLINFFAQILRQRQRD
jgi:hypothetical protein